jgi:hypothetical protein
VPQEVANKLGNFNIQRFRLAAVGWLVNNNNPISEFEKPAFRDMITMVNPEAEEALWQSRKACASTLCAYTITCSRELLYGISTWDNKVSTM